MEHPQNGPGKLGLKVVRGTIYLFHSSLTWGDPFNALALFFLGAQVAQGHT